MNVPVVLPVVDIKVADDGSLSVQVEGHPYPDQRPLHRSDLRALLDEITKGIATPVRVEVTEADGTTYADITTPSDNPPTELDVVDTVEEPPTVTPGARGTGFRAGEQIAVAYVLLHGLADGNGAATLRLPPAMLSRHQGSLVLLGLESKTMTSLSATVREKA